GDACDREERDERDDEKPAFHPSHTSKSGLVNSLLTARVGRPFGGPQNFVTVRKAGFTLTRSRRSPRAATGTPAPSREPSPAARGRRSTTRRRSRRPSPRGRRRRATRAASPAARAAAAPPSGRR